MSYKKTLFILLILFSTIPLTAISIINLFLSEHTVANLQKTSLITLAHSNGHLLEEMIQSYKQEVQLNSNNQDITASLDSLYLSQTEEEKYNILLNLNIFLNNWIRLTNYNVGAYLLDDNGIIISSSDQTQIGQNMSHTDYFSNTWGNDTIYLGDFISSPFTDNELVFSLSSVVTSPNTNQQGILVLFVSNSMLTNFINNISLDSTGLAFFLNEDDIVTYDPNNEYNGHKRINAQIDNIITEFNNNNIPISGTDTYYINDVKRLMGYCVVPSLNWVLVVKQNYIEIISKTNYMYTVYGITLFIALILSALIGLVVSKSLSEPIFKLKSAFELAALNHEYIPCYLNSRNELGALANSYNSMILQLNQNHEELNSAYQEISAAEEEVRHNYALIKEEQDKNAYLAQHDQITGLLNRFSFKNQLNRVVEQSLKGAVFFIDLDNFKYVNDVFGHHCGDILLVEFATRITHPSFGWHSVARIGGDEFLLLKLCDQKDLDLIGKKLFDLLEKPFIINKSDIYITASVGIYVLDKEPKDADEIIKDADMAMYAAKESGKNAYKIYNHEMDKDWVRYNQIVEIVRNCFDNNELSLVYQPEVSMYAQKIIASEALLRIESKTLGTILPSEFIPIAETSGFIIQLGHWTLKTACLFAKRMLDDNLDFGMISVNVSSIQLMQKDFVSEVLTILEETQLEPYYLQLEITESMAIYSMESNMEKLTLLRDKGIVIALDDFGTGYSSLNHLVNLPIDIVKIDKSFINDIYYDFRKATICKSIIDMAHSLDLKVVAEGIETKEQHDLLKELNCNVYQGYYFSKPVKPDELLNLIKMN